MKFHIFGAFLCSITLVNCANILYVSNLPSPSHFIWCKSLLYSLHERGHNLTVLSPDVEESKVNITFLHLDQVYPTIYNGSQEMNFFEFTEMGPIELFALYADVSEKACLGALKSKGYEALLKYPNDFKVDLAIYDFTMDPCILGVLKKFGFPKIVAVSPYFSTGTIGPKIIFPSILPGHDLLFGFKMNFVERLVSALVHVVEYVFQNFYIAPLVDKVVKEKHPDYPYVGDILKNIKMYLINSQPVTDYKVPLFANQKFVGGIQIKKPKALPNDLKKIADDAKNGLVLFSLGTNVRSDSLGPERIKLILKALGRLDRYTFLWKFETTEKLPIELPKNVKIQAWMPQNDILAHPNTKLFISHCGLLSTQEALWYGVPVLGFPVFGDQPQNALRLKELGVSETLHILKTTEDEFYTTLKNLLENKNYFETAKKISKALRDTPMTPLEEATYWTEWVIRNPDIDLEGPAGEQNFIVRHSIDVIVTILAVLIILLYVLIKIGIFIKRILGFLFGSGEKEKSVKKSAKKNN